MSNKEKKGTLIITGGGTGGHVSAGIAIAQDWLNRSPDGSNQVLFIGSKGGIEERMIPKTGYPMILLNMGPLNRVSFTRKLRTLFQLPFSFLKSLYYVAKTRPVAVIGVGGYVSGPVLLAAVCVGFLYRFPTAILEQNSVAGLTNRLLGKIVTRVFLAFESHFSGFAKSKLKISGNPVRAHLKRLAPVEDSEPFGIFVFGGSQGAMGMNTLVLNALPLLQEFSNKIRFTHQTGQADHERVKEVYERLGFAAHVHVFIDDMEREYKRASLLITRAGSSTLSEIAAVGRASILIPLPTAADDHQTLNAKVFYDKNAAFLADQINTTGQGLADMIRDLFDHREKIRRVEKNVTQFYRPDSAKIIVDELTSK